MKARVAAKCCFFRVNRTWPHRTAQRHSAKTCHLTRHLTLHGPDTQTQTTPAFPKWAPLILNWVPGFISAPQKSKLGSTGPLPANGRKLSLQMRRAHFEKTVGTDLRVYNSTLHSPDLLMSAQVALGQRAPSHGSRLASTQTCVPISRDSQLHTGTRPAFRR